MAQQGTVSRFALLSALELAGAGLCPESTFEAVLPPARRSNQRRVAAQSAPRASQGDGRLLREEARVRSYAVCGTGELGSFRRDSTATGVSRFVLGQALGEDGAGKSCVKWHEFRTETAARIEFDRLARA